MIVSGILILAKVSDTSVETLYKLSVPKVPNVLQTLREISGFTSTFGPSTALLLLLLLFACFADCFGSSLIASIHTDSACSVFPLNPKQAYSMLSIKAPFQLRSLRIVFILRQILAVPSSSPSSLLNLNSLHIILSFALIFVYCLIFPNTNATHRVVFKVSFLSKSLSLCSQLTVCAVWKNDWSTLHAAAVANRKQTCLHRFTLKIILTMFTLPPRHR